MTTSKNLDALASMLSDDDSECENNAGNVPKKACNTKLPLDKATASKSLQGLTAMFSDDSDDGIDFESDDDSSSTNNQGDREDSTKSTAQTDCPSSTSGKNTENVPIKIPTTESSVCKPTSCDKLQGLTAMFSDDSDDDDNIGPDKLSKLTNQEKRKKTEKPVSAIAQQLKSTSNQPKDEKTAISVTSSARRTSPSNTKQSRGNSSNASMPQIESRALSSDLENLEDMFSDDESDLKHGTSCQEPRQGESVSKGKPKLSSLLQSSKARGHTVAKKKREIKVVNVAPPMEPVRLEDPELAALFECSDEEDLPAKKPEVGMRKVAISRSQIHDNASVEKYSGIRLAQRIVGSDTMDRHMKNRKNLKLVNFTQNPNLAKQLYDAQDRPRGHHKATGDFVIIGVVSERRMGQTSKSGKKFGKCTLTDLAQSPSSVTLMFFGEAQDKISNLSTASVLLVLNPRVLWDKKETTSQPQTTFMVNKSGQVAIIGKAADFGVCKATKMNGEPCTMGVNKRFSGLCRFHSQAQLRATKSIRGGINTGTGKLANKMKKEASKYAGTIANSRNTQSLDALRSSAGGGIPSLQAKSKAMQGDRNIQIKLQNGLPGQGLGRSVSRRTKSIFYENEPVIRVQPQKLPIQKPTFQSTKKGLLGIDPNVIAKQRHNAELQLARSSKKKKKPEELSLIASKQLASQVRNIKRPNPNDQSVKGSKSLRLTDIPELPPSKKVPIKAGITQRQYSSYGRLNLSEEDLQQVQVAPRNSVVTGTMLPRGISQDNRFVSRTNRQQTNLSGGMKVINLKTQEGIQVLKRKSKAHSELVENEDFKESLERMDGLQKQEFMVEKIRATTEEVVNAYMCTDCSTYIETIDEWCKAKKHDVIPKRCIKYYFECKTCKLRSSILRSERNTAKPIPPDCSNCKTMTLVPAGCRATSTNHLYYARNDVTRPKMMAQGEEQPKFLRSAGV